MTTKRDGTTTDVSRTTIGAAGRRALFCCSAIALATLWVAPAATEERRSIESLVTLDPPGSVDSRPVGINDSGDITGLYFTADGKGHGFLLTRGVYTSIDIPGAIRTNAIGVAELRPLDDSDAEASSDGRPRSRGTHHRLAVVGRYDTPDGVAHGYRLSDGVLTTIDFPGTTFTVAAGINSSGHIVGRYFGADRLFHGFIFIDGEFTTIDYPGALSIHGITINAKGDIAGYYEDVARTFHAFLLSADGVFTTIDPPGSLATGSAGGNLGLNSRELVGSFRVRPATLPCGCDGRSGFVFRHGEYEVFDAPGAASTFFSGINRRGDIVGIYEDATRRRHGFLLPQGVDK
jgi:hypothetical protein